MKLLKVCFSGIKRFTSSVEIDLFAEQRVSEEDLDSLFCIGNNLYINNVISFVGLNASGKTTILKALCFALDFLNCNPIGTNPYTDFISDSNAFSLDAFFYNNDNIYKLHSDIVSRSLPFKKDKEYEITNEQLWLKDIKQVKTKKTIYDFNDIAPLITRNGNNEYLKKDTSILVSVNKDNGFKVQDLLEVTNINYLPYTGNFPQELVSFLDPSIEYFKCIDKTFKLKFYSSQEITLTSMKELSVYLSSGTIKGLTVFISAIISFQTGGYLIVDELENHFNREIVATLIRFYCNPQLNRNGATLLFSTHYAELIDNISRSEGIYVVHNEQGISIDRYNKKVARNDLKKSDVLISDYIGCTAPSYSKYIELKDAIAYGKVVLSDEET